MHQEKRVLWCREFESGICAPGGVSFVVQRIQNRDLYTKKTALGGVEKTNLRYVHQKGVENKLAVID